VSTFEPGTGDDLDLTPPPVGAQYHPAETEDVLLHLRDIIEAARPVPLSASSMIAKDEVLELIDDALAQLPEELRAARWLLKEREEFLARTRHEADEIVDQARARAERMVQRTEVVKAAEQRAYQIVDAAEADARRLRHEVEDFCDQKLASFEIVLERTQKLVAAGRSKLQGTNLLEEAAEAAPLGVAGGTPESPDDDLHPGPAALDEHDEPSDADGVDELGAARSARRGSGPDRSDLPPPPSTASTKDAEATFFDQDLS
jgi:cell division septum initiation protein DivIVA